MEREQDDLTPERWRHIQEIFEAAIDCAPEQRSSFLDRACGADAALLAEVQRLLAHDDLASGFIDRPIMRVADMTSAWATSHLMFAAGHVVSNRFQVVRHLASGGMGEVYHAHD